MQVKETQTLLEDSVTTVNTLYPIPKNWKWVKFNQIFDNFTDSKRKIKEKEYLSEGVYPIVDQGIDLVGGYSNNKDFLHQSKIPVIVFGDHTRRVKYIDFPFIQGADGVKILKTKNNLLLKFYYFSIINLNIEDRGYRRHFSILTSYSFPLPPLPEQERIVAKLESLLSKIKEARELIADARESFSTRRASILHQAFTGELTREWRKANPSQKNDGDSTLLSENAPEDMPYELPEGWKWVKLGEVCKNFDGKRIPVSRIEREKRKGIYPYYGATGIVDYIDNYIFSGQYLLIGEDGANLLSKSLPLAFIVEGDFWVNNHAHVLKTIDSNNLLEFINYYINSMNLQKYVSGSAQPKLTQANMNKILIPIPRLPEQTEIVRLLQSLLDKESQSKALLDMEEQLDLLEKSILSRAFRGELGTNDPDEKGMEVEL